MTGDTTENNAQGAGLPNPIVAGKDSPSEGGDGAEGDIDNSPPKQLVSRRTALLLVSALMLASLAAAGVIFAKKQLVRETETAAAPAVPIEPASDTTAPAFPEPVETPLAGDEPSRGKIFNKALGGIKDGAAAIERAGPAESGSNLALPPAPDASAGNEALQDAAKDAAKLLAPKAAEPREFDLSSGDPQAVLESLEREASANSASDFSPPPLAHAGAGISDALNLDIARLSGSLEAERQHTDQQAAEITRLNSELAALKADGSPLAKKARAALHFHALAEKVRAGEPFRREMDGFARLSAADIPPAIANRADAGLAPIAALKLEFPKIRDSALAAARRQDAKGPLAELGANFASLVRLRRAAPTNGAGAVAVFSRAEAKLYADDIKGALAELDGLTGPAREESAEWVQTAAARAAADAALADIEHALILSLDDGKS